MPRRCIWLSVSLWSSYSCLQGTRLWAFRGVYICVCVCVCMYVCVCLSQSELFSCDLQSVWPQWSCSLTEFNEPWTLSAPPPVSVCFCFSVSHSFLLELLKHSFPTRDQADTSVFQSVCPVFSIVMYRHSCGQYCSQCVPTEHSVS